mgnify:CR=1 FL=1
MSFFDTIKQDVDAVETWLNTTTTGQMVEADFKACMAELEKIPGTGNEGRVTKKDIIDYMQRSRRATVQSPYFSTQTDPVPPPSSDYTEQLLPATPVLTV